MDSVSMGENVTSYMEEGKKQNFGFEIKFIDTLVPIFYDHLFSKQASKRTNFFQQINYRI
jgi:hypothetical protein